MLVAADNSGYLSVVPLGLSSAYGEEETHITGLKTITTAEGRTVASVCDSSKVYGPFKVSIISMNGLTPTVELENDLLVAVVVDLVA